MRHRPDKFDFLAKEYISRDEKILAEPVDVEWRWKDQKKSSGAGIFVITYGALYIFRAQKRQAKIHLLRVNTIRVAEEELTITFSEEDSEDGSGLIIKSEKADTLANDIMTCFKKLTYRVKMPPKITLEGPKAVDLNRLVIRERPDGLLAIRMMFFLHRYIQERDNNVHIPTFFHNWEGGTHIQLSDLGMKRFMSHMSMESCKALAHTLSWETLNAIVFDQFMCTASQANDLFNVIITEILENARSIRALVFKKYNGNTVPKFDKSVTNVKPAGIDTWEFEFCSNAMVADWMSFTEVLPDGCIDGLKLTCIHDFDIDSLCRSAGDARAFTRMRSLDLKYAIPLEPDGIPKLIKLAPALESIKLCGKEDAKETFRIITESGAPLRHIYLDSMDFASQFSQDMILPSTLMEINVSGCRFISALVMKSFFKYLTSKCLKTPISVVAENISRGSKDSRIYSSLRTINFEKCYPNIGELDWSGNAIPVSESQWLFAFLCTQKRLKLLRMKDISTAESGKEEVIMMHLIQLGVSLPLFGLDVSFKSSELSKAKFVEFIHALSVVRSLRRLDVSGNEHAGVEALIALNQTIQTLDNLVELGFDGFNLDERNQQVLFEFCSVLKGHRSLKSFDFPEKSLQSVRNDDFKISQMNTELLNWMKRQPRLTTRKRRIQYQMRQTNIGEDDSPDLFKKALEMVGNVRPL